MHSCAHSFRFQKLSANTVKRPSLWLCGYWEGDQIENDLTVVTQVRVSSHRRKVPSVRTVHRVTAQQHVSPPLGSSVWITAWRLFTACASIWVMTLQYWPPFYTQSPSFFCFFCLSSFTWSFISALPSAWSLLYSGIISSRVSRGQTTGPSPIPQHTHPHAVVRRPRCV